mmetsp:Transcript_9569/g.26830  ORF Transcript_9569/g.26830 Transcript_9569/m.26830 type:complete len:333 (+) Transcript_9569:87-1085(+)
MGGFKAVTNFFLGVALSGNSGLRATVPLFLLSVLYQTQENPGDENASITLAEGMEWVGSVWFACVMGVLMALEIIADKIPVVDHILHIVFVVVHPVAGAVACIAPAYSSSIFLRVPALLLGALIALIFHLTRLLLRVLTAGATAGCCSPVVSVLEDVLVFPTVILAILVAVAGLIIGIIVLVLAGLSAFYRMIRRYRGDDKDDPAILALPGRGEGADEEKGGGLVAQTGPRKKVNEKYVKMCHNCEKTFSGLMIKVHCTWCGNVFCSQCVSQKIEVPTLDGLHKVCDRCYRAIDRGADAPPSASDSSSASDTESDDSTTPASSEQSYLLGAK